MDETEVREWQAAMAARMTMLLCAVRALMASHPEPAHLRAAWDQEMAALWADHSKALAGRENPHQEAMRKMQEAFESLIGSN